MPVTAYRGIRLLPNAITVLALCAGLSAVQYALAARYELAVAALTVAAIFDALDGRIARMLDATSKMGAELDSLADCVSFGVAPALVLFVWRLEGNQLGWIVALVFAVCAALRLARFNTLLDDTEQPPYDKEFFVGVPAPAAALLAVTPLLLELQFGQGFWSSPALVGAWALLVAALMVSRLRTLSMKTVRVPAQFIAPLLVLVGLAGAALITVPFLALALAVLVYLAHLPYAVYRYRWLGRHPEAWFIAPRQRRAAVRALRGTRPPGIRPPLRRRVAGAARARAAALNYPRRRREQNGNGEANGQVDAAGVNGQADGTGTPRDRRFRRLGLRKIRRPR
ncbi:CDP-diacylglycerol--serine O-phosphatidyltransferase [Pseudonocardia acaciae]|uniref:CDP-diacylglycerol--serine O-phosphatidyltransferase n=1 Tax=Pseudonocardia acaciae TaxID=551276 RepID=UPI00048F0844|nr:CDP-diacylglycerol--serine O-phosphatidyltransferase [Pseudonocardia acaciae]